LPPQPDVVEHNDVAYHVVWEVVFTEFIFLLDLDLKFSEKRMPLCGSEYHLFQSLLIFQMRSSTNDCHLRVTAYERFPDHLILRLVYLLSKSLSHFLVNAFFAN